MNNVINKIPTSLITDCDYRDLKAIILINSIYNTITLFVVL